MCRFTKPFSMTLLALVLVSCTGDLVSRVEYDAALSWGDSLEGRCDELEMENSSLKLYNEYLEQTIDSLQISDCQR